MAHAIIVFATRTGETERIAELIGEGLRISGVDATVKNASEVKSEKDLIGYDAVVLGSPTYHGDMLQSMKTLLFMAEKAGLKGKIGGSFGAFGWSGEAPDRIFDTMKNIFEMNMVGGSLRLKSSALQGGIQMAQSYGREVAEKLSA